MKILSINTFFPHPPHRGMDIVYLNLLKLQANEHEVTMVTLRRNPHHAINVDALAPYCRAVHVVDCPNQKSLIHRIGYRAKYGVSSWLLWRPAAAFYDTPPELVRLVSELVSRERFDAVEVHHSPLARLVQDLDQSATILYLYDANYRSRERLAATQRWPRSWLSRLEASRYRSHETRYLNLYDLVLCGQEQDRLALVPFAGDGTLLGLMPNVIDTDACVPHRLVDRVDNVVVFVGAMTHHPNVDAVVNFHQVIWPLIRKRVEDAQFWIVGATPPREIASLDGSDGIRVFASVPDVKPFVSAASVYVAPLRIGSGVKVKIMEALSLGKAIVASPVAAEGMDLRDGIDIRVAKLSEAFAEAVVDLLEHPAKRELIERQARATAIERFSFKAGQRQLSSIYDRFSSRGKKSARLVVRPRDPR